MIFDIWPFRFYRVEKDDTLCVSLICLDDWACGFQYGWRDDMRGTDKAWIDFRIGKLVILYFEPFKQTIGFEIWVLGFWAMPSIGKLWWEK